MDVKAGALVGFAAAMGGVAGGVFGGMFADLVGAKKPMEIAVGLGVIGGLMGAFAGGTLVAPTVNGGSGVAGLPHAAPPPQLHK